MRGVQGPQLCSKSLNNPVVRDYTQVPTGGVQIPSVRCRAWIREKLTPMELKLDRLIRPALAIVLLQFSIVLNLLGLDALVRQVSRMLANRTGSCELKLATFVCHTAEVSHRPFLTAVLYPAALWRIAVSAVGVHRPHLRSDVWLAFRDRRFASWCDLDPGCVWSGGVDR